MLKKEFTERLLRYCTKPRTGATMNKKLVLITGCSSGIGHALAEAFHQWGAEVVATARNIDSLVDLREKGMKTLALDVNQMDQIHEVVGTVLAEEKRIDILVNNAGYALMGPTVELPGDEVIAQFLTNVFAPLALIQQVAPIMRQQNSGMIVNIGSISGITTTPFSGAYCASKAALHAFSDALRMELGMFGIKVVTVQPGKIESNFGLSAKKHIERVLRKDSWYQSMESAIHARAEASQDNATPVDIFARKLVKTLMADRPSEVIRIGNISTLMPLMKKYLPTWLLDRILKKKFGLC
jgi:short-subunit dehydrogenase